MNDTGEAIFRIGGHYPPYNYWADESVTANRESTQKDDSMTNPCDNYYSFVESKSGRAGWVYLIHAQGTNRYKIGRSIDPVSRYKTLQTQSPYPLVILDCFPTLDAATDEAYLHETLKEFRVHGEWFEGNFQPLTNHLYQKYNGFFSFTNDLTLYWAQKEFERLGINISTFSNPHHSGVVLMEHLYKLIYKDTQKFCAFMKYLMSSLAHYASADVTEFAAGLAVGAFFSLDFEQNEQERKVKR